MQCVPVSHHQPLKAWAATEGQQSIKKNLAASKSSDKNRQLYEWDQSLTEPELWNPTLRISQALPSNTNLCTIRNKTFLQIYDCWSDSYRAHSATSFHMPPGLVVWASRECSIASWDSGWCALNVLVLMATWYLGKYLGHKILQPCKFYITMDCQAIFKLD